MNNENSRVEFAIPFCGFYYSRLSDALDRAEESEAEYLAECEADKDRETGERIPEGGELDAQEWGEILWKCADYQAAHEAMARQYVRDFSAVLFDVIGRDLIFQFAELVSPREYNFSTDRLFVSIPADEFARIVSEVKEAALDEVAARRHTSRSGFVSFYSPRWREWGEPSGFDNVQRETVFLAWLENYRDELKEAAWGRGLHDSCTAADILQELTEWELLDSSETAYSAFSECVDWTRAEEMAREMRAAKLETENN